MLESMYDKQLKKCTELNYLRKRYLATFRIFKAIVTERLLKREIEKLKIIEEIKKEMDSYTRSINPKNNAFLEKLNQSFDKKIS
ncbi:MAG: hypothetical protein JXB49_10525 [Bacteroidales bacterium]|nr:hypothetical protein [Bacteroidales bacterium]